MKPSCHSSRQCITLERKVNRCSKKRSITSLKGKCFMFIYHGNSISIVYYKKFRG